MLVNHHAHSFYSDGHGEAREFLDAAIAAGFDAYGFSDHAPIPVDGIGSMPMSDLPAYREEVARLRAERASQIRVHLSLEVDYLPGVMDVNSDFIREAELDYTIGAVHYVGELDGLPWSFQRPNPVFELGIEKIFGGNARKLVEAYFRLVREMIEVAPPDVVAHLDRIKRRNEGGRYWDEHTDWFRSAVEETLEAIAGAGIIMEFNTRGLYRGEVTETYPSKWIVARAHERGIPLQVNSDAHELPHIAGGFDQAYATLREIGVESEMIFWDGEFIETKI